jgi:hypothetical protein
LKKVQTIEQKNNPFQRQNSCKTPQNFYPINFKIFFECSIFFPDVSDKNVKVIMMSQSYSEGASSCPKPMTRVGEGEIIEEGRENKNWSRFGRRICGVAKLFYTPGESIKQN